VGYSLLHNPNPGGVLHTAAQRADTLRIFSPEMPKTSCYFWCSMNGGVDPTKKLVLLSYSFCLGRSKKSGGPGMTWGETSPNKMQDIKYF